MVCQLLERFVSQCCRSVFSHKGCCIKFCILHTMRHVVKFVLRVSEVPETVQGRLHNVNMFCYVVKVLILIAQVIISLK